MRTTRLTASLSLAAVLALPGLASANCYSIYDTQNRLAFQSTIAPVDLSTRISDGMRARFPGGHLIMIPDDSDCREYRTGPTLSPRFDAGGAKGAETAPEQMLQASPLLRGTGSAGADSPTREAVRTGNVLNVKRP
ncbi:MAG TPA: hypothetical protein VGO85_18890 [Caldimonas sp.]|jgi:hypothetical protein|nr:hypothetical protein [Caldimonas sp.]